jgi:hypothetical protein
MQSIRSWVHLSKSQGSTTKPHWNLSNIPVTRFPQQETRIMLHRDSMERHDYIAIVFNLSRLPKVRERGLNTFVPLVWTAHGGQTQYGYTAFHGERFQSGGNLFHL